MFIFAIFHFRRYFRRFALRGRRERSVVVAAAMISIDYYFTPLPRCFFDYAFISFFAIIDFSPLLMPDFRHAIAVFILPLPRFRHAAILRDIIATPLFSLLLL
jgi:hypothetical protein